MCKSGRAGHLLQIFIRRELVDKYCYPSKPFGVPDKSRNPLGKYLSKTGERKGQVRITVNPGIHFLRSSRSYISDNHFAKEVFLRAACVRMFVFSADPTFHGNRDLFQQELRCLL